MELQFKKKSEYPLFLGVGGVCFIIDFISYYSCFFIFGTLWIFSGFDFLIKKILKFILESLFPLF